MAYKRALFWNRTRLRKGKGTHTCHTCGKEAGSSARHDGGTVTGGQRALGTPRGHAAPRPPSGKRERPCLGSSTAPIRAPNTPRRQQPQASPDRNIKHAVYVEMRLLYYVLCAW